MGGNEAVVGPVIAVGLGCRKGCADAEIVALVRATLALLPRSPDHAVALFTFAEKRGEAGLAGAAAILGAPLTYLERAQLAAAAPQAITHSPRVTGLFGLPGVAETAALAGAGVGAVLLVRRQATRAATCAIAGPPHLGTPA